MRAIRACLSVSCLDWVALYFKFNSSATLRPKFMKKLIILLIITAALGVGYALWRGTDVESGKAKVSSCGEQEQNLGCFGSGRSVIAKNEFGELYDIIPTDTILYFGVIKPTETMEKYYTVEITFKKPYSTEQYEHSRALLLSGDYVK